MPDSPRLIFENKGGMNLVQAPDLIPPTEYAYLQNTRKLLGGRMTARPPLGENLIYNDGDAPTPLPAGITSVTRLNDPYLPGYALVIGAAGVMYVNENSVATGLSTQPLSFLPYRPTGTPRPWCYVGDPSLAVTIPSYITSGYGTVAGMLKVRADGLVRKIGIKEPQVAPSIAIPTGTGPEWVSYRYVYRDSTTQAISNSSPESVPQIVPQTSSSASESAATGGTINPNILVNSSQYQGNGSQIRTAGGVSAGVLTDYIEVRNFRLSIPAGVNIDGVSTAWNWQGQYTGTGVVANAALFYQGTILGETKSPGIQNQQTATTGTQGGGSDPWGAILTPDIVNDTTFGFGVQVLTEESGGSDRSFFNSFTITVYYTNTSATGTATPSLDPQVDTIDVYRQGPGLDNFTYVLSVPNISPSFTDLASDLSLATNPILSYQNYEPFPSIDLPQSGTVNVLAVNQDVTGISILTAGTGQTDGTYNIPSTGGGGTGAVVQIVISGGAIATSPAPFVVNPGSGFTSVPTFPLTYGGTPGTLGATIGPTAPGVSNVEWVSGSQFNVRWLPGTIILLGQAGSNSLVAYVLYNRPSSTTLMSVYTTSASNTGFISFAYPPAGTGVNFQIAAPDLAAEPSPVIWGPTPDNAGSFYFGLDPNNPGDLVWSLGNNFDSASDSNRMYVTSPSEMLMNGTVTSELSTVFSTERFWLIYPNFSDAVAAVTGTLGQQWSLVQSASTRGLYMRYAIASLGSLIGWRAKDGIFLSQGGGPEKEISGLIYNLFPHGAPEAPSPVVIGGNTVYPPDDTKPNAQTITMVPGYLFYDYQDTEGNPRTLVYDMEAKGWSVDVTNPVANCHAHPVEANQILVGCVDGTVRAFDNAGTETATAVLSTPCVNGGEARAQKILGDVFVKALVTATNPVTLALYANRYATALSGYSPASLTGTGALVSYVVDFTSGNGNSLLDVAAQLSWPVGSGNVLEWWEPSWAQQLPDSINDRPTEWMDLGHPGSNYVRGLILEANTFNVSKAFAVEDEFGTLHAPQESPITLNGQQKIGLSFNPPFVSHIGRIVSSDGVAWSRGPDEKWSVEWISDSYPEITRAWTPIMEISGPDNKFVQGIKITADSANLPVAFHVLYDGGQSGPTFTGTFNGKQTLVFSWTPFQAHDLQLVPQANARIWTDTSKWAYKPYSESQALWQTEMISNGMPGWLHIPWLRFAYLSTSAITLTLLTDQGATVALTIPSSAGSPAKFFTWLPPVSGGKSMKFKLLSWEATSSAPFNVFEPDIEVAIKPWGSTKGYQTIRPFGGPSAGGAEV